MKIRSVEVFNRDGETIFDIYSGVNGVSDLEVEDNKEYIISYTYSGIFYEVIFQKENISYIQWARSIKKEV